MVICIDFAIDINLLFFQTTELHLRQEYDKCIEKIRNKHKDKETWVQNLEKTWYVL